MTLLEVMERVGSRQTNKIIAYVTDAMTEIAEILPEKTTYQTYNVVANQKLYSMPNNMIRLLGVYRKYDSNGKYIRIGYVTNLDIFENVSGSTAADSQAQEIVVI